MWDGAITHLELQPLAPLANPIEMGSQLPEVLERLRRDPHYPARFREAFGSEQIDSQRLLRALTQFIGSMVSANSAYDRAAQGGSALSPEAEHGLTVFRQHCASCHAEPLFTDFSYRNNGLDLAPRDAGRGAISGEARDNGRFRVPSLRNIELTAPYMHDGRFASLREVIDHYAGGVQHSPTLDPLLARPRDLSIADQRALLAFLPTLTDEAFVHDARFAEPTPAIAVATSPSIGDRISTLLASLLPGAAEAHTESALAAEGDERAPFVPVRFAVMAPPVELVGVRDASGLLVHVDDFQTNAPRSDVEVSLLQGTRAIRAAAEAPGRYRLALDGPAPATPQAALLVRGPGLDLRLDIELPVAASNSAAR